MQVTGFLPTYPAYDSLNSKNYMLGREHRLESQQVLLRPTQRQSGTYHAISTIYPRAGVTPATSMRLRPSIPTGFSKTPTTTTRRWCPTPDLLSTSRPTSNSGPTTTAPRIATPCWPRSRCLWRVGRGDVGDRRHEAQVSKDCGSPTPRLATSKARTIRPAAPPTSAARSLSRLRARPVKSSAPGSKHLSRRRAKALRRLFRSGHTTVGRRRLARRSTPSSDRPV